MSTARSAGDDAPAAEIAAALRDAPFVRVAARADGDSLAASGILARALRDVRVPFHVRASPEDVSIPGGDAAGVDLVVGSSPAVGADGRLDGDGSDGGDEDDGDDRGPKRVAAGASRPASVVAFEIARELGTDPDPALGLAGVVASGGTVDGDGSAPILDAADRAGVVERRPGVAVPTADVADGVAHTTLVHAPVSGQPERVRAALAELGLPAELDEDAHRRIASLVAVEATAVEDATPRASEAIERALRPHATPDGPFETVGGYADVLDAVARERPGVGVALALGHDAEGTNASVRTAALDAWRDHARAAHAALRGATTARYDGVFVARPPADAPPSALGTVARLLRDFRSPEPVALVVVDGAAAAASVEPLDLGAVVATAVERLAESGVGTKPTAVGNGTATRGDARFDGTAEEFVAAFREAL
ncbi:exonuclease RecJ [Halegenticoccus tardaugens]|uniref:exonuclease RecJ n=1 Tax=Halegenticoccus tardaugens TaxID=2071624 RepID=UPI00100BEBF2|nr:exonuclease RecJ [Halegenticoccus tardaugens]